MSADIDVCIVFDDNTPFGQIPFTSTPSIWDLSGDMGLSGCKEYRFFAAIAGVRNDSGIEPLFPVRDFPPEDLRQHLDERLKPWTEDEFTGWLQYSEVVKAVEHLGYVVMDLHPAILNVLETMEILAKRYGDERVRLIFAISD